MLRQVLQMSRHLGSENNTCEDHQFWYTEGPCLNEEKLGTLLDGECLQTLMLGGFSSGSDSFSPSGKRHHTLYVLCLVI